MNCNPFLKLKILKAEGKVKEMSYLKRLSWDQWQTIRNAIFADLDAILETYKEVDEKKTNEFNMPTKDAVHKLNALYMKKELSDVYDGDGVGYKTPSGIWDWVKIILDNKFYEAQDETNRFVFPTTKRIWDEMTKCCE